MTKHELIAKVAEDTGLTKVTAEAAIDSFLDGISRALVKGDAVTLVGFGTFRTAERSARTGRNPQTGEPIKIGRARVPRFTPGQTLRKSVNR
ncbi:MAG: HU family DNA-binding protein [Vicinamibacterales bacterium]